MSAPYTSRCRTCGREIAHDAEKCPHCGAANLEERCPHCGAVTTASQNDELRYVCDLCGGPRVPRVEPGLRGVKRELPALRRAETARKGRARARALAAVSIAGLVALSAIMGLLWLVAGSSLALFATWGVVGASLVTAAFMAFGRAGRRTAEIRPAVDEAWRLAAGDVAARMRGPFTANRLAQAMGISETAAEELLALLDAHDVVRSEVSDAGEILYETKLRLAEPPRSPASVGGGSDLQSEQEALAEAEAEAAGARGRAERPR